MKNDSNNIRYFFKFTPEDSAKIKENTKTIKYLKNRQEILAKKCEYYKSEKLKRDCLNKEIATLLAELNYNSIIECTNKIVLKNIPYTLTYTIKYCKRKWFFLI